MTTDRIDTAPKNAAPKNAALKTTDHDRNPASALPLTHVAYHVLVALVTEPRHGYAIIQHIAECTGDRVHLEAGTLYAAIKRMREEGWIGEVPAAPGADARRRTYAITPFGRDVLAAESRRLEAMVALARDAEVLPTPTRRAEA